MIKKFKNLKKKQKIIIVIALVFLVMIMVSIYTVAIRPKLNQVKVEYEATQVTRGDLKYTVNESGAIEYKESSIMYELNLDVSDDDDDDDDDDEETQVKYLLIEEVYKVSGEKVSAGDALIKFDAESIEGVRKLLASAVADAQVDYNDEKNKYELSCLEAETDYQTTLINAKYADKLYKDASLKITDNMGSIRAEITMREGKVADLQEAIDEATETYNDAYEQYTAARELVGKIDPNEPQYLYYQEIYLRAQTSYNNALNALENAQNSLSDNAQQISNLRSQLSSAQSSKDIDSILAEQTHDEDNQSGDNAYIVYTAKLESLAEDFEDAKDDLEAKEKQQKAFEELVGEDGIVYAPKDGLIVSCNVEAGEKLTTAKVMISYVEAENLTIAVNVTEEDIVSLAIGQNVDIEFTAYPDEHFEGTIQSIETTSTSSNTNTVSYSVVISLLGDLDRMYGGMTANVSFVIESRENTLYISRKALVESNDAYYVYVKSGVGEYELKKVTIGLKNTTYVEIISGLEENETIYIATTGA